MRKTIVLMVLLVAGSAGAFWSPWASRGGVNYWIEGMWENRDKPELNVVKRDGTKPFRVDVVLENTRDAAAVGTLEMWVANDWELVDAAVEQLSFKPKEKKVLSRDVRPVAGRVLASLYPVHARYTSQGEEADVGNHPIAIFEAVGVGSDLRVASPAAGKPVVSRVGNSRSSDAARAKLEADAINAARAALEKGTDAKAGRFVLEADGERFGAAWALGEQGVIDGVLAITDGERVMMWNGFVCEVVGQPSESDLRVASPTAGQPSDSQMVVERKIGDEIMVRTRIFVRDGALIMKWDLPGVARDRRGLPHFTRLALGAGSLPVFRAYAGYGCVFEDPSDFSIGAHGCFLSTRHIGGDYTNGLSLVQATARFPDRVVCDRAANVYALEASQDAEFAFVPSARGAFAAARRWRRVGAYRASPGFAALAGKMCLDRYAGSDGRGYKALAESFRKFARYGVTNAVFVGHQWQRFGFDCRFPEVWPPNGDFAEFTAMREAARTAGIAFTLHDNYIDFYPDATGFSYDDVSFTASGEPWKAWYAYHNQGYRWLPSRFMPRLDANMRRLREGCAPDGMFLDVFAAMAPFAHYDRAGNYHGADETEREWRRAFERVRTGLGRADALTISEDGMDTLVGSLDGGQSDHFAPWRWMARTKYADAERVPWHDAATHGSFVLFGGGLADRYAALDWGKPGDETRHGYGSDDYLATTVMGGRNPMASAEFCRASVLTGWLVGDLCDALARMELTAHEFSGGNLHRQVVRFAGADGARGTVAVNLADGAAWRVGSYMLPQYGFVAKATTADGRNVRTWVAERDGARFAGAVAPGVVFADARPGERTEARMVEFPGLRTDGALRLEHPAGRTWRLMPLPGSRPFTVELDLAALGAPSDAKVTAVEPLESGAAAPRWSQSARRLTLTLAGDEGVKIKF